MAQKPDAQYKLIRKTYKVNTDGSMEYNFRKEITLLRNRAITAYADKGETFIVYNPEFQNLTINESYTQRADGSRVKTPHNAFIEQLPKQCENCGRLNNLIELAIVHTALEYDCTIVLDYTITSKSNLIQEEIVMTDDCPIEKYEIIVDLPKNQTLHHHLAGEYYAVIWGARFRTLTDAHTFHLVGSSIPQSSADPYLPTHQFYPTLYLSNAQPEPSTISLSKDKLPEAQTMIVSIRKEAQQLYAKDHSNSIEDYVARHLQSYVIDNIHLNDIPQTMLANRTATPLEIWQSGCATPLEKAILLAALLRQAGMYAYVNLGQKDIPLEDGTSFPLNDQSLISVNVTIDGQQTTLSAIHKDAPKGQTTPRHKTIEWTPTDNSEYATLQIPNDNPLGIDASLLTPNRKAPVQTTTVNDTITYDIHLTADAKLVKTPPTISYSIDGIGSISVMVKQYDANITIEKTMTITTDIIDDEHYADFRKMMIDWQQPQLLYLKRVK